jgi:hypothetical protein
MSFTAFNAPKQQKIKTEPVANNGVTISLVKSAFSERPDLVKRLEIVANQGAYLYNHCQPKN